MRRAWLALATSGCNSILGLEPTKQFLIDAPPDAVFCSAEAFAQGPFALAAPTGADPSPSANGLELWFDKQSGSHQQVFVATRARPDVAFDAGAQAPFVQDLNGLTQDPTITADGLNLLYIAQGGSSTTSVYEVARTDANAPFPAQGAPRASVDLMAGSLAISPDGLTLYFSSSGMLYMTTRPRRDDSFLQPSTALGFAGIDPAISADELELFYDETISGPIRRSVRRFVTDPFTAGSPVISSANSPGISADSTTLYVNLGSTESIATYTRMCP